MRVESGIAFTKVVSVHQQNKQTEVERSSFADQVKTKENMSLEEYKVKFQEKMDNLYTHPSQKNRNDIIDITDAAYKRMQVDPEYEKKILDCLAKNKGVNFGQYIPQVSYMHIDDTWEGTYGYTQGMQDIDKYIKGNNSGDIKDKKSKMQKAEEKKKEQKELLLEYVNNKIEESKYLQELRTEAHFKSKEQSIEMSKRSLAEKAYDKQAVEIPEVELN